MNACLIETGSAADIFSASIAADNADGSTISAAPLGAKVSVKLES
jgi:hypothetical protein